MSTKKSESEKEILHPLEEVFNIEDKTTVVPYTQVKTDLVPHKEYDKKDDELEGQLQELYDIALEAFEMQQEESDVIDPKYRARNAEVAVQYLKTALEAVREKRQLKEHKDKIVTKQTAGGTVNNNIVVSHNDLLDAINDAVDKKNAVEGEYEEK